MFNQWGYPPQQPVVFIPPQNTPSGFDIDGITRQIAGLEALKKLMKEEKKDDKPKEAKKPDGSVIGMMLFMLLMSPITGPFIYMLFQFSAGKIH